MIPTSPIARGVRQAAACARIASARLRARKPGSVVLLAAALAVSCSSPVVSTKGERSCDRNGDYEERMACSP